jgi:hypothetical protein
MWQIRAYRYQYRGIWWPGESSAADERARWRALGSVKFQDADYNRYAQDWRGATILQASGWVGYAATAALRARLHRRCPRP